MVPALLRHPALALALGVLASNACGADAIFLVSGDELADPNFEKTVVLVTNAPSFAGPFGVIVNRPTPIPLAQALPDNEALARVDDKLFVGGPVMRSRLMFIYRSPTRPPEDAEDVVEVLDGVYLSWSAARLKELLARAKPTEGLRVYAGHSGWAPGQLESEVERGSWRSARADAHAIFETPSHLLWPELSRRASMTTARLAPETEDPTGGLSWH